MAGKISTEEAMKVDLKEEKCNQSHVHTIPSYGFPKVHLTSREEAKGSFYL
jgi:hypothetical protein